MFLSQKESSFFLPTTATTTQKIKSKTEKKSEEERFPSTIFFALSYNKKKYKIPCLPRNSR